MSSYISGAIPKIHMINIEELYDISPGGLCLLRSSFLTWIERVAQTVAQEIEAEDDEKNRHAR